MAQCDLTYQELADSLTGFDEIAIKKAFGVPVSTLAPDPDRPGVGDAMQFLRSAIFTDRRRKGDNDITAYNFAQNLPMSEVTAYFPEESIESGEDGSEPEKTPTSSLPGAS